ncbi:MAG: NUDIX domain-containing protein [Myxococcales bacterium]
MVWSLAHDLEIPGEGPAVRLKVDEFQSVASATGASGGSLEKGQHVVAVAALIVRAGRVLSLRRAPTNLAGPGLWETVSGRVEHGEEPLAAVAREIEEESGLVVELETRPFRAYAAQRRGQPMIVILFRAAYVSGQVRISEEHDEHAWLTAEEFAQRSSLLPLVDAVKAALRREEVTSPG